MTKLHTAWKQALFVLLSLLVLLGAVPVQAQAAGIDTELKTVRVGYFAYEGYNMLDGDGNYSGYGYDFMQMAARYNDWDLEYVGYDCNWAQMQQMLRDGEIDVLTSAQKTPEREAEFAFTDKSIGTSSVLLTVRAGETRYEIGNYAGYAGMKVGMITGNSRNEQFALFAAEKGFAYTPVYFDTTEALMDALQNSKTIDAVVTSSLRKLQNETILEEFSASGFYAMVRPEDTALLGELNYAIEQMDTYAPGWRTSLDNEYYSAENSDTLSFSASERQFLKRMQTDGTVLRIITNPEMPPYSYFEKGEAKGIAPALFAEMADRIGLQYEYVEAATREEYNNLVKTGDFDIDLTCFSSYSMAEAHGVRLTDAYMSTSMALLNFNGNPVNTGKIARVAGSADATTYTTVLISPYEVVEYDSLAACERAIVARQVDGIYLYAYTAQQMVSQNERNQLQMNLLPEYSVNLAVGVRKNINHSLVSILNKGVQSVQGDFSEQVILRETTTLQNDATLTYLLYHQPTLVVGFATLVMGILGLALLFATQRRATRRELAQARQLERFIGYVCKSYDTVEEVDLDRCVAQRYYLDGQTVKTVEEPYHFAQNQNPDEKMLPEDHAQITTTLSEEAFDKLIAEGGGEKYFECRMKNAEGVYTWYAYTLRAIPKTAQHHRRFILFKKDINESKLAEEKQRRILMDALETARGASAAKGDFLSKMSHEIRTPLNAVIGYLTIAKMPDSKPEKIRHCIDSSELAAKHLLNIINDVLDMSSIESGKLKIANESFDLKQQLTTVSAIFYSQAKAKNVRFEVTIHDLTEEWVVGDQMRVNQILMNLLSNAVKFTPENGTVRLDVTQMSMIREQVHIKFEISDTGIGMSPEYLQRIFTPFEQESASTARKFGGSGLGLSITKNLVSMMQGSIEVQSKQNEGTTFTVTLVFRCSEENKKLHGGQKDFSDVRALVVDDEKHECDYVKALLKRCSVKCDTVQSGKAAVKQINRRKDTDYPYDLCILDWNMPDMDGVETAKIIHEGCDPALPIIIATAYDIAEIEEPAKAAGVDKIISKPLFQSTMFDLLVSTFGKYQPKVEGEIPQMDLSGIRILLVEDNAMNMEIALDILQKSGLVVDTAEDGQQALDRYMASTPGFYQGILMDIQMPVMDGYTATKKIRASGRADAATMPIIAMTANAFAEDVSEALACGMNDHISKPIDYNKLFNALAKFLKKPE